MKKTLLVAAMTMVVGVAHGATIEATQNGSLYLSDTWGGATIPTEGNTDTWDTNGRNINLDTSDTFHGGTLLVRSGSTLITSAGVATTFQATTFDNGGIRKHTNQASTYDFSNKALTFAAGGATFTSNDQNRNININNGVWAGSGPITFKRVPSGAGGANSVLTLMSGNNLSGYSGTISVVNESDDPTTQPVRLRIAASTTGSFGVNLGANTTMSIRSEDTAGTLVFSSLVLGDDVIGVGTYAYTDFTVEQQAFFLQGATPVNIQVIPEPGTYAAIFGLAVLGIALIRRSRKNRVA